MNIYDPPMIYAPLSEWADYLDSLKIDGADAHKDEISRTIEVIKEKAATDGG